ncbi:hypothetical protein K1W54_27290 [Micromonospora sp. CPCC 205371]|nr:hypothetical protein [Micromonospora sp. CPCC 205371]
MLLGLRIRRARLQTASRILYRRRDGRTITLVGTCHIGERAYFDELVEHICFLEAKGAQVLCEGAHAVTDDPDAPELTDEQKQVQELLNRADQMTTRRIAETLGWTRQKLVLTRETWLCPDMSMDQVQRESDGDELRRYAEGKLKALYWPEGDNIAALQFLVDTTEYLRQTASRRRKAQRAINAALPAVVVDRRRQHAIDQALATIGQGLDVVMVWGAGHQPAMLSDLAGHGFARTGPAVWHTVGKLPTYRQRVGNLLQLRMAAQNGYVRPADRLPEGTAVGITAPAPGWVYEMNEPDDEQEPHQELAATDSIRKGAGTGR